MISIQIKRNICILFLAIVAQASMGQSKSFLVDSSSLEQRWKNIDLTAKNGIHKFEEHLKNFLHFADSMAKIYPKNKYIQARRADALSNLGYVSIQNGGLDEALERLNRVIVIKTKIGKENETNHAHYLKGIIWTRYDEYDKAKESYDIAYKITDENIKRGVPQYDFKVTMLSMYAAHYANVDSIQLSTKYFERALNLADSVGNKTRTAVTALQFAEVLHDNAQISRALALRQRAMRLYGEINDTIGQITMSSELAASYHAMGRHVDALMLMEKTIHYYTKTASYGRLLLEYPLYLTLLKDNKKFAEAFNAHEAYIRLKDSLRNASNYKELADLEASLKIKNTKTLDSLNLAKEFQIEQVESKKKASTRLWTVVTVFLVLAGGITFFLFRNRQKIKEQAYQNILLNNKVATKTEEINELLTETIKHIKSKERIAENLQKLSTQKDGVTLKSIIADLKASKADNAKLMLIKQNIEQVNFEFIKKLKTQHPELTKTDIEICSFIRIGLSRKEIANLRNTSLEAVKSSRFRIKKKLQLTSEDSLDSYINSL